MSQEIKKPVKALHFLNKKGQGIVEFALILAFCVGIGLAAREAGLGEALDKAFAGTGEVTAPKDIQPGVSTGSSGSSTTVTIDQSNKTPERTDAKYTSMTSDEVKDFNFLNDLKDYFTNHPTDNSLADDIWNAYKGNRQFADAEAEARSRNVGLALLGKDLTGDNAVTDAVWKDLKADKNWAFDTDDQTIHAFLNNYKTNTESWDVSDPDKLNGYIDDLQTRNVYFANLEANDIANMLKNIGKTSFVNSAGNGSDFYDGYLEIKKQFWPDNPVSLSLAKTIADFTASSDENRIYNYVQDLKTYFNNNADKIWNAFNKNGQYQVAENDVRSMLNATNIVAVEDSFWIQAKGSNNWELDSDDSIIKTFLSDFVNDSENAGKTIEQLVDDLQKRNKQFKNIDSSTITGMIANLGETSLVNADVYSGYLGIKQQFWGKPDPTIQLVLSSQGSVVVKGENAEQTVLTHIIDVANNYKAENNKTSLDYNDYEKISQKLNTDYSINIEAWRLSNLSIADKTADDIKINFDLAQALKIGVNWALDEEDSEINAFLKAYMTANRLNNTDEEYAAIAHKIKSDYGTTLFSDIEEDTIIKMLKNPDTLSADNATVYKGYWQIKKKFWNENAVTAMPTDSITNAPTLTQDTTEKYGVQLSVINADQWNDVPIHERRAVAQRGAIFVLNNEYWIYTAYDSNLTTTVDLKGKSIKMNIDNPIQKSGQYYAITGAGDVVIENGNIYVYSNAYYIEPTCSSAAESSNFMKIN